MHLHGEYIRYGKRRAVLSLQEVHSIRVDCHGIIHFSAAVLATRRLCALAQGLHFCLVFFLRPVLRLRNFPNRGIFLGIKPAGSFVFKLVRHAWSNCAALFVGDDFAPDGKLIGKAWLQLSIRVFQHHDQDIRFRIISTG